MSVEKIISTKKWRPHHIFCLPHFMANFPERGKTFNQTELRIKETIRSGSDTIIEVIEGVDELCQTCSFCQDDGCQSPNGNEDAVRKWDKIILNGLGISYGERRTAKEFRNLIDKKAPLTFCRTRCPWKDQCSVFG